MQACSTRQYVQGSVLIKFQSNTGASFVAQSGTNYEVLRASFAVPSATGKCVVQAL